MNTIHFYFIRLTQRYVNFKTLTLSCALPIQVKYICIATFVMLIAIMRNFADLAKNGNQARTLNSARENGRLRILYAGSKLFQTADLNGNPVQPSATEVMQWLRTHIVDNFEAQTGFKVTIDHLDVGERMGAGQVNQIGAYANKHIGARGGHDAGMLLLAPEGDIPYALAALSYGGHNWNAPILAVDTQDCDLHKSHSMGRVVDDFQNALAHLAVLRGYPFMGMYSRHLGGSVSVFDLVPRDFGSAYYVRNNRVVMTVDGQVRQDLLPGYGGLDLGFGGQDDECEIALLNSVPFHRSKAMEAALDANAQAIIIPVESDDLSFLRNGQMLEYVKIAERRSVPIIPVLTSRNGYIIRPSGWKEDDLIRGQVTDPHPNVMYAGAMTLPAVVAKLRQTVKVLHDDFGNNNRGARDMQFCLDHMGREVNLKNNRLPELMGHDSVEADTVEAFLNHSRRRLFSRIRRSMETGFHADMGNMPVIAFMPCAPGFKSSGNHI